MCYINLHLHLNRVFIMSQPHSIKALKHKTSYGKSLNENTKLYNIQYTQILPMLTVKCSYKTLKTL